MVLETKVLPSLGFNEAGHTHCSNGLIRLQVSVWESSAASLRGCLRGLSEDEFFSSCTFVGIHVRTSWDAQPMLRLPP